MIIKKILYSCCVLLVVVLCSCGGLEPLPPKEESMFTGISGTVTFTGGAALWPKDSIYDLRVVAFEKKPTVANDILVSLLSSTAVISEIAPFRVDSFEYNIEIKNAPKTYTYIVVAMQVGPNIQNDWRMLDVYSETKNPEAPSPLTIEPNKRSIISFTVDFSNLPPQPF